MFLIQPAKLRAQFSSDFQGGAKRMTLGVRRFISSNEFLGFVASLASQLRVKSKNRTFYSQSSEDSIISKYCSEHSGRYLDVGAGRPISGSNSYFFYKKGWSGILIDPISRNHRLSQLLRPRDKFERVLVGQSGLVTFFETYPYQYSTTSQATYEALLADGLVELKRKSSLTVKPLSSFNLKISEMEPSFLSIDAEGADFEVLQSNDWNACKPRVICVESPQVNDRNSDSIVNYLYERGYLLVEQTHLSKIFVSKRYLESTKVGS
jgi:hypothetical protein